MTIVVGTQVRIQATFMSFAGAKVTPANVVIKVHDPTGDISEMRLSDGQVFASDVNVFYADFLASLPGKHLYRVEGTSPAICATEGDFVVARTKMV